MNGVKPDTKDHGVEIAIVLASRQKMKIPKQTLRLHRYVEELVVFSVPKQQDIPLGMPWLKAANPDINWV
ncbi:hypothetical protein PHMEG_00015128 [Phytophthora megakarya]|uniref:Uncharacterized protein n=1 Tax=Phytophthora megakarya TaxID=4795 RepID=A0A225W225_9STRA|nr:hypothetical protein PHMEG_00015128 [Phytophthora megakarya]